jgi:mannosylglycerate hydrolase MGH1-like protein
MPDRAPKGGEWQRLDEDARRQKNWKRWGPYLSERQWGTVREDYSANGDAWGYFPHDHARSRAYRWGEDGLLGITDRECRLCFALALWNGRDPILKERLYGLTNPEGNHGEDVKELYYYLDATPTSAYLRALYKYPQAAFPYQRLIDENGRRGRGAPEFELEDTGVFDDGRYFDVEVEYAKADVDDILIRISCANRGPDRAPLHVLPTLWQRNTWSWGRHGEGYWERGNMFEAGPGVVRAVHPSLGAFHLCAEPADGEPPGLLFTDNVTNIERLFNAPNPTPWVKDAFHRRVVGGERDAVNPAQTGSKAAAWYALQIPAGGSRVLRLRLTAASSETDPTPAFDATFDAVFADRKREADAFYAAQRSTPLSDEERAVVRQADAGLLWSRQFYSYVVEHWLEGDPAQPPPPPERRTASNHRWKHVYARDVLSMPDKWEYPWFASWDLAFHCVALARIDPQFAKEQVLLLCREWYMHPSGQLPAYEYAFGDANPPVQAWAAWRLYQLAARSGEAPDPAFLEAAFQKCLVNFTWWVNRQDEQGNNLFSGGFLGLDNVGVFDRSKPLPGGGQIEQADATAWMAFYCTTMLAMALELARTDAAYADIASKFFEHFVLIAQAMNEMAGRGLWDETDGFYYDQGMIDGRWTPFRLRSAVGIIPLFAAESLDEARLMQLPHFKHRLDWFLANKPELAQFIAHTRTVKGGERRLLSIPTRERLTRVLGYVLDENEFLSPFGIRSLSKTYADDPYVLALDGQRHEVRYVPGDSDLGLFGGNSNWRGPVWFPLNYLLIDALKRHHHFYGDSFKVECPRRSGRMCTLRQVAEELESRLARLFLTGANGRRPSAGDGKLAGDPHFRDLMLFHEYFHGDTGRGLGASHQTGWTALAGNVIERVAAVRGGLPTGRKAT